MSNLFCDPTCRDTVHRLSETAREIRKAASPNDAYWTASFKEVLRKLGARLEQQVWGHGDGSKGESLDWQFHEWLFDVVWADRDGHWNSFRGLRLACEIEWQRGESPHLEDFLKLTVCRADLRLFVFGCKPDEMECRFDLFKGFEHAMPGRYLAVAVQDGWHDLERPLDS